MKKAYPTWKKKKKRIKIKLTVEENLHYSATGKWKTEFRQTVCHDWHWSDLLEVRHEILKQLCVLFKFLSPFLFPFVGHCWGGFLKGGRAWLACNAMVLPAWWPPGPCTPSHGLLLPSTSLTCGEKRRPSFPFQVKQGHRAKMRPHDIPKSISAALLYSLTLPGPHGSSGQPTHPSFTLPYWCGLSLREIPELLHT